MLVGKLRPIICDQVGDFRVLNMTLYEPIMIINSLQRLQTSKQYKYFNLISYITNKIFTLKYKKHMEILWVQIKFIVFVEKKNIVK